MISHSIFSIYCLLVSSDIAKSKNFFLGIFYSSAYVSKLLWRMSEKYLAIFGRIRGSVNEEDDKARVVAVHKIVPEYAESI